MIIKLIVYNCNNYFHYHKNFVLTLLTLTFKAPTELKFCQKQISNSNNIIMLVPRRSEGRGERTPGTHCLRMRLISEISRKIGYFSNPPCNDDV